MVEKKIKLTQKKRKKLWIKVFFLLRLGLQKNDFNIYLVLVNLWMIYISDLRSCGAYLSILDTAGFLLEAIQDKKKILKSLLTKHDIQLRKSPLKSTKTVHETAEIAKKKSYFRILRKKF